MRAEASWPGCGSDCVNKRAEGFARAELGFEGHGADDVGEFGQPFGFDYAKTAKGGHRLSTVGQGQAFFGLQCGGLESGPARASAPLKFSPL